MKNIYKLKGKIQNYDWGGDSFIPTLVSEQVIKNNTYAEYWMGAHAKAPSTIITEKDEVSLDTFINNNQLETLGQNTLKTFGKLPYLFKVLDVKNMLSIQVHPSVEAAKKGYELEDKKGIALTAKNRNYKDKNHKPEIMVALSDFWLLHGFLQRDQLIKNLKETSELSFLLTIFLNEGYLGLYKKVMNYSQKEVNEILQPLVDKIVPKYLNNQLEKSSPAFWAARSITNTDSKDIDKGIFSIYFFNILNLSRGEAIFQDAGVPHAYLEGKNIELMANSDNVLRAGLTSKHIDVDELIKNTKFEETIPEILSGNVDSDNIETIFKTKARDFELSKIAFDKSKSYTKLTKSIEIFILLEGDAIITDKTDSLHLQKGDCALINANTEYKVETSKEVEIYKAGVPE